MIRAIRFWWLARRIDAAEVDRRFYMRGVGVALTRAKEYKAQANAATDRARALRLKQSEIDYPIHTTRTA